MNAKTYMDEWENFRAVELGNFVSIAMFLQCLKPNYNV